MRYESLAAAPAAAFGPLIGWLGQDPPAERLDRAIRFSAFTELRAQEDTQGFKERVPEATGRFFGSGQPGHWRDVLTRAQQARIEHDHGAVMQRFGYL